MTAVGWPHHRMQFSPESSRKSERRSARVGLGQSLGHWPGDEQATGGQGPTEEPVGVLGAPGAIPAEPIAINQAAGPADLEVLDDLLELESLRKLTAVVPARQPDVTPDQTGAGASSTRPR